MPDLDVYKELQQLNLRVQRTPERKLIIITEWHDELRQKYGAEAAEFALYVLNIASAKADRLASGQPRSPTTDNETTNAKQSSPKSLRHSIPRLVLAALVFTILGGCYALYKSLTTVEIPERTGQHPRYPKLPQKNRNNLWYEHNSANTVVIFVHGIFSDSRSCWLAIDPKDPQHDHYWPQLVLEDTRFQRPSIFLAGYATGIDSGKYDTRQAAADIRDALKREGVLEKQRIIFIAHSLGGIVTRFLLTRNQDLFTGKQLGLVLYASPSRGSQWADRLGLFSTLYANDLARQLRTEDNLLTELDKDFRDLLYNPNSNPKTISLVGAEAVEQHFIVHRRFLPNTQLVVTEESAARYFGAPRLLRTTDHFSIVKPTSQNHPAHEFLLTFNEKFNKDLPPQPQPDKQIVQETHGDASPAVYSQGNATINLRESRTKERQQ
jgi:pimeloyl-ACP methyl ester carboxylesterase